MMKLKSLFRRGHGPPSGGSGTRPGKRGAPDGTGQTGAVAPGAVAGDVPPPPPGAGHDMGVNGNGVSTLPRQQPQPQPQEALVRAFGSAEKIPKQQQLQAEAGAGALKGAASISSLDSKHHHHHKFQAPGGDGSLSAASNNNGAAPTATAAPATVNNNSSSVNNNNSNGSSSAVSPVEAAAVHYQDLQGLQGELEKVSRDKLQLQQRVEELSGCQGELHSLRQEVALLRGQRNAEMDLNTEKMTSHSSALSDSEKEQLLLNVTNHQKSPIPSPINNGGVNDVCATTSTNGVLPDVLDPTCVTPDRDRDWDKHSCSSLSEVSVACLQDRIMQMEETHYSTNEELQATLQELADLQTQLTELQSENERLTDEKGVLLESLCRQTEKLEDSRTKVDTLQELLLREEAGNGPGGGGDTGHGQGEREQKLVELLKSGQEEREALLVKQEELTTELMELRGAADSHVTECARLADRVRLLESTVDATHAERKQLDQELALAKEESSSRHIEISRLSTLLDNARAKIEELERARELGDKSDIESLLDNVRKEKDILEGQVATLQEQLSRSQCEVSKLREQLSSLQEECKVMRNNAKCARSDLEYQCEQVRKEKALLATELATLQESANELRLQCQCHLEDKRQLKAALSETQRHCADVEQRLALYETDLAEEKRLRSEESAEWQQFQSDLLMTVRVANDFKTEAQHELEKLVLENKTLRDKVRSLESQLEKLKAAQKCGSPPPAHHPPVMLRSVSMSGAMTSTIGASVGDSVLNEIATARRTKPGISRQDSRLSVKSLIESIENAAKQAKTSKGPGGSRSSSTSSLSSIASDVRAASVAVGAATLSPSTPSSPLRHLTLADSESLSKGPLRDQQSNNQNNNNQLHNNNNNNMHSNNRLQQQSRKNVLGDNGKANSLDSLKVNSGKPCEDVSQVSQPPLALASLAHHPGLTTPVSILASKTMDYTRRNSCGDLSERKDPLAPLVKNGGSKKSVGIPTTLNINDMILLERPDWQQIMAYVTAIYIHFET
ncbi:hypothetical protein ONE63_004369 [Megalurothrips usitatus]|uniref:Uncharacterized protein n=1 Tax=Megalurothrips usitatus TaxID=439358 RepID=A0AAV7X2L0_9NEOP|nr:hypothetical protein ONE63_004369 [Megalurothrips usitatus]